jgi:hypothetical protein
MRSTPWRHTPATTRIGIATVSAAASIAPATLRERSRVASVEGSTTLSSDGHRCRSRVRATSLSTTTMVRELPGRAGAPPLSIAWALTFVAMIVSLRPSRP